MIPILVLGNSYEVVLLLSLAVAVGLTAAAQAPPSTHVPGASPRSIPGQPGHRQNRKGRRLTFTTNEKTQILHAQPGLADPKNGPRSRFPRLRRAISGGLFRGSADQKPLLATALVIRTKADLNQLAAKKLEDWTKRGTTGVVAAVDPEAHTIGIKVGTRTITVHASEKTAFHRYSPDSAAATDAKPSTLAEVKVGDQLKVLGNKTADGGSIAAEVVYAGTFRQIPALIASVDAATGELKVTDLETKKPLYVRVNKETIMKKLPPEMAQMLAMRFGRAGGRGQGRGQARGEGGGGGAAGQEQAQNGGPGRFAGRGGMRGGGRGGDLNTMLDGLPSVQLADLKPKDAIMVTTTVGSRSGEGHCDISAGRSGRRAPRRAQRHSRSDERLEHGRRRRRRRRRAVAQRQRAGQSYTQAIPGSGISRERQHAQIGSDFSFSYRWRRR